MTYADGQIIVRVALQTGPNDARLTDGDPGWTDLTDRVLASERVGSLRGALEVEILRRPPIAPMAATRGVEGESPALGASALALVLAVYTVWGVRAPSSAWNAFYTGQSQSIVHLGHRLEVTMSLPP